MVLVMKPMGLLPPDFLFPFYAEAELAVPLAPEVDSNYLLFCYCVAIEAVASFLYLPNRKKQETEGCDNE